MLSVALLLAVFTSTASAAAASPSPGVLMDNSGGLRLKIPTIPTTEGIVAVVTSPSKAIDKSSSLLTSQNNADNVLALDDGLLICRGATLQGTSAAERSALALTSVVSDAIVVDGITVGDIEAAGWKNTRHARTLTAFFRSRLAFSAEGKGKKQALIMCIKSTTENAAKLEKTLLGEVKNLFEATVAEAKQSVSFSDLYDVQVNTVATKAEAQEAIAAAKTAASDIASSSGSESSILASVLQDASERIKESGITSVALDPPHIAQAFVAVSNAHAKQSKSARAKIAGWKSRAARGLWSDGFGSDAEAMRKQILSGFDSQTLLAAGLPLVASYRLEMRNQLAALVDSSIADLFDAQAVNLEIRTLKRLHAQLLKKMDKVPVDEVPSENAAAIRAAMFAFDTTMKDLEVPSLSLTKTKSCREMEAKLTDEVATFDDSPAAQIKRMKKVTEVTSKDKKPGQRSVDFGLDLVAVLRPDGYGTLQGFAGYNLGGNSITFGIHNDADDPQTIAQFGGVRPPLLRVQPKLRVDVEM
ncbi:MAG: hypothetical protein SGILL_000496 [Bacillariaceae sp.]